MNKIYNYKINIIIKMVLNYELSQYFTTHNTLKETLFKFILNNPSNILEPSIGQGDLISFVLSKTPHVIFDMYEIDNTITLLSSINTTNVIYCDFINQIINKKYNTIIGNPPFIKTKKGNLYIDFIKKCFNLLDNNGELIFIIPSDFFKLTSASKLLNEMMDNGSFTHIFHPHNENMFENASVDIIIFRYCKNKLIDKKVLYNNELLHIVNNNGLLLFNKECNNSTITFKDYFDIYVGIVSGKEDVYKNEKYGNIEVINKENKIDKYIYIEKFPCNNENINAYLSEHKNTLINRAIRVFNEKNWFEWGAPRNISIMNKLWGNPCIYINTLTRTQNIAFLGQVGYFGGGLIILIPKKKCNLQNIVSYLNSINFKNNFMYSKRFKIGHRQICNSYIPLLLLINETTIIKIQQLYRNYLSKKNTKINQINQKYQLQINQIIKIQKWFRGCYLRLNRMPTIMYVLKQYLQSQQIILSTQNTDGRINSCIDEDTVINILIQKFNDKIKIPKIRMWFDILAFDIIYGWIPINIKTTTTLTNDNIGNLALCVYSYTNEMLELNINKTYENGIMSNILHNKLKNKNYNINNKKDYYFIVLNKTNTNDIIINSVKGLSVLTSNINNLPFQVCWNKNRIFKYAHINNKIKMFINCLQKSTPSWKEIFLTNVRMLNY